MPYMTLVCSLTHATLIVKWREIRNDFLIVSLKWNVWHTLHLAYLQMESFQSALLSLCMYLIRWTSLRTNTMRIRSIEEYLKRKNNFYQLINKCADFSINWMSLYQNREKNAKMKFNRQINALIPFWIEIYSIKKELNRWKLVRFTYGAMCFESICNWANVTTLGAADISIETSSFRQCVIQFLRYISFFVVIILFEYFSFSRMSLAVLYFRLFCYSQATFLYYYMSIIDVGANTVLNAEFHFSSWMRAFQIFIILLLIFHQGNINRRWMLKHEMSLLSFRLH